MGRFHSAVLCIDTFDISILQNELAKRIEQGQDKERELCCLGAHQILTLLNNHCEDTAFRIMAMFDEQLTNNLSESKETTLNEKH